MEYGRHATGWKRLSKIAIVNRRKFWQCHFYFAGEKKKLSRKRSWCHGGKKNDRIQGNQSDHFVLKSRQGQSGRNGRTEDEPLPGSHSNIKRPRGSAGRRTQAPRIASRCHQWPGRPRDPWEMKTRPKCSPPEVARWRIFRFEIRTMQLPGKILSVCRHMPQMPRWRIAFLAPSPSSVLQSAASLLLRRRRRRRRHQHNRRISATSCSSASNDRMDNSGGREAAAIPRFVVG